MNAWQSWYQRARLQRVLAEWRAAGCVDVQGHARAQAMLAPAPDAADWLRFWRDASAWLAMLLLCAGAVCFIAANWSHIPPLARIAGVQVAMVLAVAVAWPARVAPWVRTLGLFVASVLVGVLLALIGQTYQTGADPWGLFALWAVLMLPWTLVSRAVPLWLLLAAVANAGLLLWGAIFLEAWAMALAFALTNGAALAAWESVHRRRPLWDPARLGARILAGALVLGLGMFGMMERFSTVDGGRLPTLWIWLAASVGLVAAYRYARRDVPILALWVLTALGMFTLYVGWFMISVLHLDDAASWLLVALLVITAAAAGAHWLRALARPEAST